MYFTGCAHDSVEPSLRFPGSMGIATQMSSSYGHCRCVDVIPGGVPPPFEICRAGEAAG
jgi:hypothetical protein